MTDLPPDVQRGIKQYTLPGASSLAGQTTIPVYTAIDVETNTTLVAVQIDESSLAGKTSLREYIPISIRANNTTISLPVDASSISGKSAIHEYKTIICFLLLCIYV